MHFNELFNRVFAHTSIGIDKRLHTTLLAAAQTLCECRQLSIASLGRSFRSPVAVKYLIKRVDRLFGNVRLHERREQYYRLMVRLLVGGRLNPVILVDWSGLTRCGEFHFLRASVPVGGRALVIWESTYREKEYASAKAHREFVQTLKGLLPQGCKPIVITDAGFRNPWFKLVRKQGWDFIGRVRHQSYCRAGEQGPWVPAKELYSRATRTARHLFRGELAKANPICGYFYLYKGERQNRKRKNLRGKKIQSSVSLKHAKRGREPWLLLSSLSPEQCAPSRIVALYRTRMQIEEAFRDLKNTRNGFSLRHCRSFKLHRLNVALLLSALATLALWILGLITKQTDEHHNYQANTIRDREVLSTLTIGWQSLARRLHYQSSQFKKAIDLLQQHAYCHQFA